MYPDKNKAKLRKDTIQAQLSLLFKERSKLNNHIEKLSLEDEMLTRLLSIYEIEENEKRA